MKWSFLPNNIWPHYVVANADESEPGTFKDREIMEGNPFQFLEGLMIASYAVQANAVVRLPARRVLADRQSAWTSASPSWKKPACWAITCLAAPIPCACTPTWAPGPTSAAKKSALLESIEGNLGQPRLRPPFPAVAGLYRQADRDQQRRNPGQRPADHRERRRLVSRQLAPKEPRGEDLLPVGLRQPAGQLRAAPGHHLPPADLRPTAAASRTGARSRPSWRPGRPPP